MDEDSLKQRALIPHHRVAQKRNRGTADWIGSRAVNPVCRDPDAGVSGTDQNAYCSR